MPLPADLALLRGRVRACGTTTAAGPTLPAAAAISRFAVEGLTEEQRSAEPTRTLLSFRPGAPLRHLNVCGSSSQLSESVRVPCAAADLEVADPPRTVLVEEFNHVVQVLPVVECLVGVQACPAV